VADLVAAMKSATAKPISVKCRLGIDDMDIEKGLDDFVDAVRRGGVDHLIIHARKAWLKGLSPKENRDIPPLDYDRVYDLKRRLPDLPISINGGIASADAITSALDVVDGVMIGRAAYQQPFQFGLWAAMIYGLPAPDANDMMARMADYADVEVANGERVIAITRHMLGFANGQKGARRWRRMLSEDARAATANGDLIRNAWEILMTARKDAA